ncbi:hypothetical protein CU313_06555 [Prochlorococcus marinus str. MU1404]|nr:hypothetical protein [Prochlorococcus marinus str. MU1404]
MKRKDLIFRSVIFKIFSTYLMVYFLAHIFKYTYDLESILNNIQYKYLIALNIVSIFLGLPFSIIFDFILVKFYGLYYVFFFSPVLTILSVIQVLILRKIKFKFSSKRLFLKKPEKNNIYKFFENVSLKPLYILIIRSFPILPHVLGSYIIASSKIKKEVILVNTFLGSFFYYIFLFLLIGKV